MRSGRQQDSHSSRLRAANCMSSPSMCRRSLNHALDFYLYSEKSAIYNLGCDCVVDVGAVLQGRVADVNFVQAEFARQVRACWPSRRAVPQASVGTEGLI